MSVSIYALGLIHCCVCAPKDMPLEEVEKSVNELHPTGIASSWSKSEDSFANGSPNPSPCEKDKACVHYLMSC